LTKGVTVPVRYDTDRDVPLKNPSAQLAYPLELKDLRSKLADFPNVASMMDRVNL
jgi:hypothetical protein